MLKLPLTTVLNQIAKDESIWKNIIINAALSGPLPPGWEETRAIGQRKY